MDLRSHPVFAHLGLFLLAIGMVLTSSTIVFAENPNTFSYNHQVGYEAAAQTTTDPLVGALLSRQHSPLMGRFFFEISDTNRRREANKLANRDVTFNALSSIPVVGGLITGGLYSTTGIYQSNSTGLAYGVPINLSVNASRIDSLFHQDSTTRQRPQWSSEASSMYSELRETMSEEDIKQAFRGAIADTAAQSSPANLEYLHSQLALGQDGILACNASVDCRRFEGFQRVSDSPSAQLPVPREVQDALTSMAADIRDIQTKLQHDTSLSATERATLRQDLRVLQGDLRDQIASHDITNEILADQQEMLQRIEAQTAPRVPSPEEIEQLEIDEMLSNPLSVGGQQIYVPSDIRDELRLATEGIRTADALIRLTGNNPDAQKFVVAANTAVQVTGAISTISKLSSTALNAKTGAMLLASSTTIIGGVGVAMELFAATQPDPTQVALQQIIELLGQVLENQRIIMEQLDNIESGQELLLIQITELSESIKLIQTAQRDLGISILSNLNIASCERQILLFDLSSRIQNIATRLQLDRLAASVDALSPETIYELRVAGHEHRPPTEAYIQLISLLPALREAIEQVSTSLPPSLNYINPITSDSSASPNDIVLRGAAAQRLHACGSSERLTYHQRRAALREIFDEQCANPNDCSALEAQVDGLVLQDLLAFYIRISDILLNNQIGTNAIRNDIYGIRNEIRNLYNILNQQELFARSLLTDAIASYNDRLLQIQHYIRYAIQLDIASVLSDHAAIGWSQRHSELEFEEYVLEAERYLQSNQIRDLLFNEFYVRGRIAEQIGLGSLISNSENQLRYYWHASNWLQDGPTDFWRVAGLMTSSAWFSFEAERLGARLEAIGIGRGSLDRFLDEDRLFTGDGKKFLLDGIFRFTQYRSIVDLNDYTNISRGYHHANCWDFLSHQHLFRPGSVSTGSLPTEEIDPNWRDIAPASEEQMVRYRRYLRNSCVGPIASEHLLYSHSGYRDGGNVTYPESYDTPLRSVSEMINFSRSLTLAAIMPEVEAALAVTRDDWHEFVVTGAHSTSIPDYRGWRPVPYNHLQTLTLLPDLNTAQPEYAVLEQIYGPDYGWMNAGIGLRRHRDLVHSAARVALSKLSAARLAVITALELGYGSDCIASNANLHTLYTAAMQGSLVSGADVQHINTSDSPGRVAMERLTFSYELTSAFQEEFDDSELSCETGYYFSQRHLDILSEFEAGLRELQ